MTPEGPGFNDYSMPWNVRPDLDDLESSPCSCLDFFERALGWQGLRLEPRQGRGVVETYAYSTALQCSFLPRTGTKRN